MTQSDPQDQFGAARLAFDPTVPSPARVWNFRIPRQMPYLNPKGAWNRWRGHVTDGLLLAAQAASSPGGSGYAMYRQGACT